MDRTRNQPLPPDVMSRVAAANTAATRDPVAVTQQQVILAAAAWCRHRARCRPCGTGWSRHQNHRGCAIGWQLLAQFSAARVLLAAAQLTAHPELYPAAAAAKAG